MFCNGRNCSHGDRCRFLHVIPDKIRDISMISDKPSTALVNQNKGSGELGCRGFVGSLRAGFEGNFKRAVWKTKLCNNWKMTGSCPYGKVCNFAHGPAGIQAVLIWLEFWFSLFYTFIFLWHFLMKFSYGILKHNNMLSFLLTVLLSLFHSFNLNSERRS